MLEQKKENKSTKEVEIDKEFYEELEAEAAKKNISVDFLLSEILFSYFFPLSDSGRD